MSCNGCRVLRKGCSEGCVLRQCLRPIQGSDAQAHATAFVAKFFGRASMMAFISAVPESQRPELFQSLLYEACGRTVNPVHGSVGLLCSGNWHACQLAVQTVLRGGSLSPLSLEALNDQAVSTSSLYFPTMLSSLWPQEGLSTEFYGLFSCQKCPRAAGTAGFKQGGWHGAPQSPCGSIFHPLPVRGKRQRDLQCELKENLQHSQSLSPDSTDEQQKKIRARVDEKHQQKQQEHVVDPWKSTKVVVCKQEQVSEQHQGHFSEEDVNDQCLELTLSTNPCYPLIPASKQPIRGMQTPPHPSCISMESEGSVSSLDSIQISNTQSIDPHSRILYLLR